MDVEKLASIVESVKVMQLRTDDVVIVRLDGIVSDEVSRRVKDALKSVFGDHKILVLDSKADIEIVRPNQVAA